jgi:hypothetical protein
LCSIFGVNLEGGLFSGQEMAGAGGFLSIICSFVLIVRSDFWYGEMESFFRLKLMRIIIIFGGFIK